jgi:hypothetical protein
VDRVANPNEILLFHKKRATGIRGIFFFFSRTVSLSVVLVPVTFRDVRADKAANALTEEEQLQRIAKATEQGAFPSKLVPVLTVPLPLL